jgi:hypothetical protein
MGTERKASRREVCLRIDSTSITGTKQTEYGMCAATEAKHVVCIPWRMNI